MQQIYLPVITDSLFYLRFSTHVKGLQTSIVTGGSKEEDKSTW